MNLEFPPDPRAELESRLTALLLGELPPEEAAALRQTLAHDPDLAALHHRLSLTLDLVRETAATSADAHVGQPAPLRLSPARRESLLASFKTVPVPALAQPQARRISWLVPLAAAAAMVLLCSALLLPALSRAKNKRATADLELDGLAGAGAPPNHLSFIASLFAAAPAKREATADNPELSSLEKHLVATQAALTPANQPTPPPTVQIYTPPTSTSETFDNSGTLTLTAADLKAVEDGNDVTKHRVDRLAAETPVNANGTSPVLGDVPTIGRFFHESGQDNPQPTALTQRQTQAAQNGVYDLSYNGPISNRGFGGGGVGSGEGSPTSAGYVPNGQIAPATMTIDPVSGSILYATDAPNNSNVLQALRGLDSPRPQRYDPATGEIVGPFDPRDFSSNLIPITSPEQLANLRNARGTVTGTAFAPTTATFFADTVEPGGFVNSQREVIAGTNAPVGSATTFASESSRLDGVSPYHVGSVITLADSQSADPGQHVAGIVMGTASTSAAAATTQPSTGPALADSTGGTTITPAPGGDAASGGRRAGRGRRGGGGGGNSGASSGAVEYPIVKAAAGGGGGFSGDGGAAFGPMTAPPILDAPTTPDPAVLARLQARPAIQAETAAAAPATVPPSERDKSDQMLIAGQAVQLNGGNNYTSRAQINAPSEAATDTRFASVTQTDTKGIGFNWLLGNTVPNNGSIGVQGGTVPSYTGPSTVANPSGIFPGPGPVGASGQSITPLATITGILTDPQFRMAINATSKVPSEAPMPPGEITTGVNNLSGGASSFLNSGTITPPAIDQGQNTDGRARLRRAVTESSISSQPTGIIAEGDVNLDDVTFHLISPASTTVTELSPHSTTNRFNGAYAYEVPSTPIVLPPGAAASAPGMNFANAIAVSPTGTNSFSLADNTFTPHYQVKQQVTSVNTWDGDTRVINGVPSTAPPDANDLAQREDAFREMKTVELHKSLEAADADTKRGDVNAAAQDYLKAVNLIPEVKAGNPSVDSDKQAAIKGLDDNREKLARNFIKVDEMSKAKEQVANALKFDPTNEKLITLRTEIDQRTAAEVGRVPNPQTMAEIPGVQNSNVQVATLMQDGKLLYELGRYDEAEGKLKQALKTDPSNTAVPYYLDLIQEARYTDYARRREIGTNKVLLNVEKEWLQPNKAESLPQPKLDANNTNIVYTSTNRQAILAKLQTIRLSELDLGDGGRSLSEVMRTLKDESRKRDLEGKGINFTYNSHPGSAATAGTPNAALAVATGVDPKDITVRISPPLDDLSLKDALDAICQTADLPPGVTGGKLAYTIGDYAIWFYIKPTQAVTPQATPAPNTLAFSPQPSALPKPPSPKPATNSPIPQSEVQTRTNAFSTFSLNVSDVSFKLAEASLQKGALPDPATVRSEEFINAFDYRDPEPAPGAPVGFAWERAAYPFAHNRDLVRFSVKTAAEGRDTGRPLNLVLLLDKSGSMECADRVAIIREALRVLGAQLQPRDTLSVVLFARTARLWADGVSGSQAASLADALDGITPEGGTNLEEAMKLAYETALRHYLANGENRVVLLTDGAANLGDVKPEDLQDKAKAERTQGIALDCFGVGWEDYNDNLLELLSRSGGGRYGFINAPEEAATEFAGQLAGALRVAASDVKVQVEFNPDRVTSYRQIGYAKDQLTKEQFRDNTVKAAQLGVKESGNALYTVEINPQGNGPICTVHVRYRTPGTADYYEHAWDVPYTGASPSLDQAAPAIRLAASASAFSEWLAGSPYAGEVTPSQLLGYMRGIPELYGPDHRPAELAQMLQEAKSIAGQ